MLLIGSKNSPTVKMKNIHLNIFFIVYLLTFVTVNGQSTMQASATGRVTAEVISAFSAIETSQLYFGKFSPGPQGGEIILTPDNTISVLGSVYTGTGTHNAASFYVTGDTDAAFSITLPSEPSELLSTTNAKRMLVSNWISYPVEGVGTGRLEKGSQTVYIGATLLVGTIDDNPPGIYTGTYLISFDFN